MIAAKTVACLAATLLTVVANSLYAADGVVVTLEPRPGVKLTSHHQKAENAVATVLLFTGGGGSIGLKDGEPTSGNFLIRSRSEFLKRGFNVIAMGRPSDRQDLDGTWRSSTAHAEDIRQVVAYLKAESKLPVWLVGTSMGTISATTGAIALGDEIAGIVLTSSMTSFKFPGIPAKQSLEQIRLPVLVLHHSRDACHACQPHETSWIIDGLKNAKIKKRVFVDGGSNPRGDPCEAFHWHGYIGMEEEAVDLIARWIKDPAP